MGSKIAKSQTASRGPFLISFSGIDGAGKTTQIEQLEAHLRASGLRVVRLSFWDDVAVWSKFRAGVGGAAAAPNHAAEIEGNSLAEDSFVPRNNKHVRKWYLTAARSGMYVLDVWRLRRVLAGRSVRDADVVIFDRYVYDQVANIDLQSSAARAYARMVLKQAPVPDLAFIVDASPDAAFGRKPEYPLEFVYKNRRNFLRLREIAPEIVVISEGSPEEVTEQIHFHILQSRLLAGISAEKSIRPTPDAVVRQQTSCRVRNEPTASV